MAGEPGVKQPKRRGEEQEQMEMEGENPIFITLVNREDIVA